jgi:hypothetical protein
VGVKGRHFKAPMLNFHIASWKSQGVWNIWIQVYKAKPHPNWASFEYYCNIVRGFNLPKKSITKIMGMKGWESNDQNDFQQFDECCERSNQF